MKLTRSIIVFGALSFASAAPDAPAAQGNPIGVTYIATLPKVKSTPIRGSIQGASTNGTGVKFEVQLSGFPASGAPYVYHIHEFPLPPDGNCTAAGPHLDPEDRGEMPPCNATEPQTCQVGDLAGKHDSVIAPGSFYESYIDVYVSGIPGTAAFFGNRSLVVHDKNLTRLTCANFTLMSGGTNTGGTNTSSASNSSEPKPTTTSEPSEPSATGSSPIATFTGAAAQNSFAVSAGVLGLIAFLL